MAITMTRFAATVVLFAFVIATPLAAQKTPSASKAWIKAPAAGDKTAHAFVVVDNPTMYDVYVVSAETDVAEKVTFEQPAAAGAAAQAVAQLTAPAYDSLELKPEGVHMVLTGLKKPLNPGDKVTIVLATDSGLSLEVSADVRKQ